MKRTLWMAIAVIAGLLQFMLLFGGVAYYRNMLEPFQREWIEALLLLAAGTSLYYPAYVYVGVKGEFRRLKKIEKEVKRSQNQ